MSAIFKMAAKTRHKNGGGFMKFCPVVPEICGGQVHASRKERIRIIIIKIIIRNGAKTISPPNFVWET
jgi:hypothetical protein